MVDYDEGFVKRVNACFHNNDVRCVVGKDLDKELAYRTAKAAAKFLKSKRFIVAHDMRTSSLSLRRAFVKGLLEMGVDVLDVGQIDSPGLYFASGKFNLPGAMITASHNPAKYNGIKLVRAGAIPIGQESGLREIQNLTVSNIISKKKKGKVTKKNIYEEYKKHILSFANLQVFKECKGKCRIKVLIDAGNGMAGQMVPLIFKGLPFSYDRLHFKVDGRFPNHVPNPMNPENLSDLKKEIRKNNGKYDLGIAFDGDMDRVVFVDQSGKTIDTSLIAAILIRALSFRTRKNGKNGKINVVYNAVMSKVIPQFVGKYGGRAYREKVGHSFIKNRMRKEKADFGAELSAHYYYKDNFYSDSALITCLIVLESYAQAKIQNERFSELIDECDRYFKIPELSFKVKDKDKVISKISSFYMKKANKIDRLDGLTFDFGHWWFNVRKSNTEPVLRLNLESENKKDMFQRKNEIVKLIKNS